MPMHNSDIPGSINKPLYYENLNNLFSVCGGDKRALLR